MTGTRFSSAASGSSTGRRWSPRGRPAGSRGRSTRASCGQRLLAQRRRWRRTRAEHSSDRAQALAEHVVDLLGARAHERCARIGSIASSSPSAVGASDSRDLLLEARVDRDRPQRLRRRRGTAPTIERPSAWRAYSASSAGSRVSRALSPTASTIAPRSRIDTPSRQQRLEHPLQLAERELVGHDLLHDGGVALLELVEQVLGLLAREQLGGVARGSSR